MSDKAKNVIELLPLAANADDNSRRNSRIGENELSENIGTKTSEEDLTESEDIRIEVSEVGNCFQNYLNHFMTREKVAKIFLRTAFSFESVLCNSAISFNKFLNSFLGNFLFQRFLKRRKK
jgi:hypothetical protein